MADTVNGLNRSIRTNNPKLRFKHSLFDVRLSIGLFDPEPVVRMHSRKKDISDRSISLGLDAPHSTRLRRDCHFSRGTVMRPAAGAPQPLSIKQRCFTPPELLGQKLVLGNIYGASNVLLQRLVF